MKKLLLLAIVAIFSLGASAQELKPIKDAPAGTIKVYKRSGLGTTLVKNPETGKFEVKTVSQETMPNMKVVFTADNQVYIQSPYISMADWFLGKRNHLWQHNHHTRRSVYRCKQGRNMGCNDSNDEANRQRCCH